MVFFEHKDDQSYAICYSFWANELCNENAINLSKVFSLVFIYVWISSLSQLPFWLSQEFLFVQKNAISVLTSNTIRISDKRSEHHTKKPFKCLKICWSNVQAQKYSFFKLIGIGDDLNGTLAFAQIFGCLILVLVLDGWLVFAQFQKWAQITQNSIE